MWINANWICDYANSPFYEGAIGPHKSERAAVWLDTDPHRRPSFHQR